LLDNYFEQILLVSVDVEIGDQTAPFIRPNKYVNYSKDSPATQMAAGLFMQSNDFFDYVNAIYHFIVVNIAYDYQLAETVQFGYMPDLNLVLERGSGICFDMAALATAMLRSQGIPAKMVVGGYTDPDFGYIDHAWVSVFSQVDGWVDDHIFFNGGTWNILDPSVEARLGKSGSLDFMGDGNASAYYAMFYY